MPVGISLGWNCHPAMKGIEQGLRKKKIDGYKTCPFDEMITNYDGIVQCIEDDFQDFCTPETLELKHIPNESKYLKDDFILYNKKYRFFFNHESPGHGNLWMDQKWPGGINHFIANNYEKFIERYAKRIQNFREYLNSGEEIVFLIVPTRQDNFQELRSVISRKYPSLKYTIVSFPHQIDEQHYEDHMKLLCP